MNSIWRAGAFALAGLALCGCPQRSPTTSTEGKTAAAQTATQGTRLVPQDDAAPGVTLSLSTRPVSADVTQGEAFAVALQGTWAKAGPGTVYLQASDSEGRFVVPAPSAAPARDSYRIVAQLRRETAVGTYDGTLTVRACVDPACTQVYPDTTRSVGYQVRVNAAGEWGTLQRNARHDGYVPIRLDATRLRLAWTWQNPAAGAISPAVTAGDKVFVSASPSLFALRAADGVAQWRRVFSANRLNPPTVSAGVVYAATTGHEETYLYALQASDGQQRYQSRFYTQWASILNPTVHGNRVFVNSGYYGGVVYAFDAQAGGAAWNASGGTYGYNSPAVDDTYAYIYNGSTLDMLRVADGVVASSIGPSPGGIQQDYNGTVMLGSPDHVFAYEGATYSAAGQRQLVNFSVASGSVRWRSISLYANFPAVAKRVVYATSNETDTLDALDEQTGRLLWSWRSPEPGSEFIGNVLVTDNLAIVSTKTRLYAIDLLTKKVRWSAPTPGHVSLSQGRMLLVASPWDYYGSNARLTAYRAD